MKRVIIIISVLMAIVINAQETPDPASFFPTAVGNVWEYSSQSGSYKFEITRDSVDADYNHFIFYDSFYDGKQPLYKINPFYSVFAIYGSVHPALYQYYRLNADTFDTWRVENEAPRVFARVDKIFIASIFGMERYVKQIGYYRPPTPFTDSTITEETTYERYVWLASGIGEIYEFDYESGPVRILQGCIIDGITYGKVYVEQKETIPSEFILYQNYPNPFNPTTNIEYDLPNSSQVSLKIYNIIGEEIRKLVDEYQSLGKQKVTFEARGLPSGVYIYRLTAGDKIYSRKMIYTK